jgi:predicted negative regulator of RcsB-dependent stress response
VAFHSPPPTDPDRPPGSLSADPAGDARGGTAGTSYPQQTLLPQQVERRRSRTPLYVGLLVVLVLVISAVVAWRVFGSSADSTRAAYCSTLKRVTHNGDLRGALSTANVRSLNQVAKLEQLAPSTVRGDWDTLQSLVTSAQAGNKPDVSTAISALTALKGIADEARKACGIPMRIPGLP